MQPKDMEWVGFREYAETGNASDREWHSNFMANTGITLICRSVYLSARLQCKNHAAALTQMINVNIAIRDLLGWPPVEQERANENI